MTWLQRLKNLEAPVSCALTKPTESAFVRSDSYFDERRSSTAVPPVNDATLLEGPDRWCWPYSEAMNGNEIARFQARVQLFISRGSRLEGAEELADSLVLRDRDLDDRRVCLECINLRGRHCMKPEEGGAGTDVSGIRVVLQRCAGFREAETQ